MARDLTGLKRKFQDAPGRWPQEPDMFQTSLWPDALCRRWEPKMNRQDLAALLIEVVNHFMGGENDE